MDIWNNEQILGYPVRHIQRLLQYGTKHFITKEKAAERLNIAASKAAQLIDYLDEQGYLQKLDYPLEVWLPAVRGKMLAESTIRQLMTETVVTRKEKLLLQRIEASNNNADFVYQIAEYSFRRQYLEGTTLAKYLLLKVTLEPKEKDEAKFSKLEDERRKEAGRSAPNILAYYSAPRTEVIQVLRSRLQNVIVRMEDKLT